MFFRESYMHFSWWSTKLYCHAFEISCYHYVLLLQRLPVFIIITRHSRNVVHLNRRTSVRVVICLRTVVCVFAKNNVRITACLYSNRAGRWRGVPYIIRRFAVGPKPMRQLRTVGLRYWRQIADGLISRDLVKCCLRPAMRTSIFSVEFEFSGLQKLAIFSWPRTSSLLCVLRIQKWPSARYKNITLWFEVGKIFRPMCAKLNEINKKINKTINRIQGSFMWKMDDTVYALPVIAFFSERVVNGRNSCADNFDISFRCALIRRKRAYSRRRHVVDFSPGNASLSG